MSIGFLTLDIIIILVIFISTFIFSFTKGKKKVLKLLLSIYPAILIFQNLPFSFKDNLTQILAFVGVFLVFYFILKNNFTAPQGNGNRFFESLVASIASVFCLLIIYYRILPLESVYDLRLPFSGFWIQQIPFYITLIIPAALIFLISRKDN